MQHKITTADGADLAVFIDGDGPLLLCVSGLGGAATFWSFLVSRLSRRFTIIRFDQRGIGQSTRGRAPCTIGQLAADAAMILKEFGRDSGFVIGHSTGGCIAQAIAAREDRLAGLILGGSWLGPNRYMQQLFRLRLALLRGNPEEYAAQSVFMSYPPMWLNENWDVFTRAVDNAPTASAAQSIVSERIGALLAYDGSLLAPTIKVPVLVLGAKDDLIVPAFLQRELAASIQRAELRLFSDGGHFFPITRADEFDAIVTEAIEGWTHIRSR